MDRNYTQIDRIIAAIDEGLRVSTGEAPEPFRPNPAGAIAAAEMDERQRAHAAGLMRINHTGEVCAQALYAGQAATARDDATRQAMQQAAEEEIDHLSWCEDRLKELDSRPSLLNPLWYAGSFAIGALAGIAGDKWSLGFVAETERQVEGHLDEHLEQVPAEDRRTRAILEQMKSDEIAHGQKAMDHGGAPLPGPIRVLMKATSKIMTQSVYRICAAGRRCAVPVSRARPAATAGCG